VIAPVGFVLRLVGKDPMDRAPAQGPELLARARRAREETYQSSSDEESARVRERTTSPPRPANRARGSPAVLVFLKDNKKWWLAPIVISILGSGLVGTARRHCRRRLSSTLTF